MSLFSPFLSGAVGIIVTIVVSFLLLTLIASYYRFQTIVKLAENTQPEEMGSTPLDVLHIQLVRYIARSTRNNTAFSLGIIRIDQDDFTARIESPFVQHLKKIIRKDDTVCVYDDSSLALLLEMEPEDSVDVFSRIVNQLSLSRMIKMQNVRVGIASYPDYGVVGKNLIKVALEGLAQSTQENPIVLPEPERFEFEEEQSIQNEKEPPLSTQEKRKEQKQRMIDPLTGVLKPKAISIYMQRMMGDVRYRKKRAALFSIGINDVKYLSEFHNEKTIADILVTVGELLQNNLRINDLIGRHESYAFLVLMETDTTFAASIGKRIATLLQQRQIVSNGKRIKINVTIGIAIYPEHGKNLHQIYESAQKVLDYNRANDIRAHALYDPKIHARTVVKPMRSIKSVQA